MTFPVLRNRHPDSESLVIFHGRLFPLDAASLFSFLFLLSSEADVTLDVESGAKMKYPLWVCFLSRTSEHVLTHLFQDRITRTSGGY